jgi:hypothetical protein
MTEVQSLLIRIEHAKEKIGMWSGKGRMDRVKEYKAELKRLMAEAEKMNDEAEMSK